MSHDRIMRHSFSLEPYINSFIFFRFHGQRASLSLYLSCDEFRYIVGFHKAKIKIRILLGVTGKVCKPVLSHRYKR